MRIAVTGGTGFLGQTLLRHLVSENYEVNAWYRSQESLDRCGPLPDTIRWIPGSLGDTAAVDALLEDADMLVHAALYRPGAGFRGAEGDIEDFVQQNVLGSIQLFEAARRKQIDRTVFVSTCAVHEVILDDRPLDETHPLWPLSHYGAHKAALEKFVHSYGKGMGMNICSLRPTGIYGPRTPIQESKWYSLVQSVVNGDAVTVTRGGKEVHVYDVAAGISTLLSCPEDAMRGESFNCYDRYISDYDVATYVKQASASPATISGDQKTPKHQIETGKLQDCGMHFGGTKLLEAYLDTLIESVQQDC